MGTFVDAKLQPTWALAFEHALEVVHHLRRRVLAAEPAQRVVNDVHDVRVLEGCEKNWGRRRAES